MKFLFQILIDILYFQSKPTVSLLSVLLSKSNYLIECGRNIHKQIECKVKSIDDECKVKSIDDECKVKSIDETNQQID